MISTLTAVVTETASLKNFLLGAEPNCAYDRWISHLAEGVVTTGYNTYAPYDRQLNGFGDYVTPNTAQLDTWGNIVDLFLAGELEQAEIALSTAGFPYQVVQFNDTDSNRTYYMLREIPDMQYIDDNNTFETYDDEHGAFGYGWGLYIYNPQGTRPIIVTTPHPCDDFPSPSLSYEAFNLWDAKFFLISGAGREVKWTNVAPYNNSKSLSDPTRVAAHPFNVAYKKFADLVRVEFQTREFSVQLHTYDWNYHAGYPNVQISAGYNKLCPNLPIRDLSTLKMDMINQGNRVMIPANTIGIHRDVMLNDFYAVNYNIYDFTFADAEGEFSVNDYIDLPAYSQNQQMLYTLSGWNDYDTYDPFFHIEMDELPNSYELTDNTYKWFYSWDENLQMWDFNNLFTNFDAYYMPWVTGLYNVLDPMFAMNDQLPPTTPTSLAVLNQSLNSITLSWNKTNSYDFYSYEVLYATQPIGLDNYQIYNRDSAALLASPNCESITVTGLNNASEYFFRIRAKDKNGMISDLSNEVTTIPAPANVYSFTAHGMDNTVRLYWGVSGQTNNQGFKVYRKAADTDYVLLDSYQTNAALSNPTAGSFEWWDNTVVNGQNWTYKISCTNLNNMEFFYNYPASAAPLPIHKIWIKNANSTLIDSVFFAQNPYASDGQDNYYDVTKANPSGSYVWNAFWQAYWGNNGTQLQREIRGGYNTSLDVKSWTMRVRSSELNVPLFISASDDFDRSQKLYLYDSGNGTWHNLFSGPYQFTVANSNVRTMTIYWGNIQPKVVHGSQSNRLYQGGDTASFYWSNQNSFLIDYMDLYLKNSTDSLYVASSLPGSQSSYSFMLPQSVNMQAAKLMIDVHAVDGIVNTYASPYVFGFVPTMSQHYSEPGWQTRSNPWPTMVGAIEDVFGAGATALIPGDGGPWTETSQFSFGTPYWINSQQVNFYSTVAAINPTETSYPLYPGWNFVPNPHLCAYPLNSIRFYVGNTLFRYSEMISQKLVSRGVFVYREGKYQMVDSILPYESFFIKYYGSVTLAASISFYPYYEAPQISPPSPNWQLKVDFSSAANDSDGFVIGTNPISHDDYDFNSDLPAAPPKPFSSLRSYLVREAAEDVNFLDTRLSQEFRAPFVNLTDDEKIWLFKLSCPTADPVSVNLTGLNLPPNYTVRMYINDQGFTMGQEPEWTFIPTPGTYNGMIKVTNYPVTNTDLVQSPISGLKIFPNPFNPSATIAFSMPKTQDVKVDIYNIKGQKVCNLQSGLMAKGEHKLVWNGKDKQGRSVSSGIYFAKVSSGVYQQNVKMVLMK
jgi:hypothetical protein